MVLALTPMEAWARYYPGGQFPTPTGDNGSPGFIPETAPGAPVGTANPLPTSSPTPSSFITFQAKISVNGTAVQLPSNALVNGLACAPLPGNIGTIEIGGNNSVTTAVNGSGNGYVTGPNGAAGWSQAISNSNLVWINGTAGDGVSCTGN
jgi:hypothetical protein